MTVPSPNLPGQDLQRLGAWRAAALAAGRSLIDEVWRSVRKNLGRLWLGWPRSLTIR